ncbi:guanylate kinase [Kingella negevensis]|uniref:Guanylate kinase n=1 Tax=Kingella negevensis TaxID=1522312 RepID=A0A238TD66_9NEIS|nr:guanylate kinase [Kingella negevensis]MDK4680004.1 guanylate kinase [Kingella negevensis]MDK4682276.1 guanylate kinase [Kingella negevensis]MDK4684844.1 guanylate kinase [Kingella negevensis]MDK4690473.1 guanylate kinase [Kingella negevensis]MDK4692178.1 guanylate kinase [Kingella negevensis]
MTTSQKGNVFIISAASGTGKTTLVTRLVNHNDNIRVSISHTTRAPRENEQHGKHYYFVTREQFSSLIEQSAFLEHAEVFGNFYGTSSAALTEMCEQGYDVILEIDVQGAEQVRKAMPEAISIFILPPSMAVLEERLRNRQTDSKEVIARRLSEAEQEIQHAFAFDYIVTNRDLVQAESDLLHIFKANRLNLANQRTAVEKVLQNQ